MRLHPPVSMKRRAARFVCIVLAISTIAPHSATADDASVFGVANIQRTMGRMAVSTAAKPATVRWQFYGQSITAQPWTDLVERDLKQRFPTVNFVFYKPAIGGFTSPALIRTAEHDLYPWYPDLLVFHVYGPVDKYEGIIRNVRARTTAEIVLWTSHLGARDTLDRNPDADPRIVAIREIAKRYGCQLIDVRKKWIAYVRKNHIEPSALLRDSVHLNDDGVTLLASFMAAELVYVPSLQTTPLAGKVKDVPMDSPSVTRDTSGDLTLSFSGNRVVAVASGQGKAAIDVLLDGKPMSDRKELWAATRPSTAPQMWMPAIKQVSFENAPLAEDWTLICLPDSASDGKRIHFRVSGSVTGEDGEGVSNEGFVSKSGRVVIEPADWHLAWCLGYRKLLLPEGFQIHWKTYPLFTSSYKPQPPGTETVLVQNCVNGPHRLTLRGSGDELGVLGFRVYEPAPAKRD